MRCHIAVDADVDLASQRVIEREASIACLSSSGYWSFETENLSFGAQCTTSYGTIMSNDTRAWIHHGKLIRGANQT